MDVDRESKDCAGINVGVSRSDDAVNLFRDLTSQEFTDSIHPQ